MCVYLLNPMEFATNCDHTNRKMNPAECTNEWIATWAYIRHPHCIVLSSRSFYLNKPGFQVNFFLLHTQRKTPTRQRKRVNNECILWRLLNITRTFRSIYSPILCKEEFRWNWVVCEAFVREKVIDRRRWWGERERERGGGWIEKRVVHDQRWTEKCQHMINRHPFDIWHTIIG